MNVRSCWVMVLLIFCLVLLIVDRGMLKSSPIIVGFSCVISGRK